MHAENPTGETDIDFRRVFDASPDAYLLLAADPPSFTVLAASRAYLELTGVDATDLEGRSLFEVFPEVPGAESVQMVDTARQALEEVVETGDESCFGLMRYDIEISATGESAERYWSARNYPIFDDDGELRQILHRAEDVTDILLGARLGGGDPSPAQPDSQRVLVVDPRPDKRDFLTDILGPHWQVESVSDAERALGVLARSETDLVLTAGRLTDGSGLQLVERIRSEYGAKLPVVVRIEEADPVAYRKAFAAGADDVIGGNVNARDYVSRTRAQLAKSQLRALLETRSRERYRQLFTQTPVAIALLEGPEHVFKMSNPAHQQLTGDRPLEGQKVREAFPEPGLQAEFDHLDEVYATGEPYVAREHLVRFEGADGEERERYVTFAYLPFRDLDGEVVGVATFAYDVSELVRMRKRAERLAREAQRESERKDEFLAMLGHELRNPLTPIVHAAEILRRDDAASNLEWARGTISRQSDQLRRLVDDLLDISRINSGRLEIERTECQLDEIVDAAIETCRPKIDEKRQHLDVDLPSPPVVVDVDRQRIVQVVANLLDNASKYTPPEGHIRIRGETEGPELRLEVCDDGRGIDAGELSEIFGLFAQSKPDLASTEGGLGVGLSLVEKIAALHDGSVEAHSDGPGEGARFVVELPVAAGVAGTSDATDTDD